MFLRERRRRKAQLLGPRRPSASAVGRRASAGGVRRVRSDRDRRPPRGRRAREFWWRRSTRQRETGPRESRWMLLWPLVPRGEDAGRGCRGRAGRRHRGSASRANSSGATRRCRASSAGGRPGHGDRRAQREVVSAARRRRAGLADSGGTSSESKWRKEEETTQPAQHLVFFCGLAAHLAEPPRPRQNHVEVKV